MPSHTQDANGDGSGEPEDLPYVGTELELFAHAVHWKRYFAGHLRPYLGDAVLEVGAGIGGTTKLLLDGTPRRWLCLEPSARLADDLRRNLAADPACNDAETLRGTVADLPDDARFDTILYVDVLEHLESDHEELERAARHLVPGGALVVLSPAHAWLFTEFDRAIGHYRRYSRRSLQAVGPPGLGEERVFYLDSVGMLASLGNRLLLRSAMPTAGQIGLWDSVLVRLSRWIDPLLGHRLGKTVVGVWRRPR